MLASKSWQQPRNLKKGSLLAHCWVTAWPDYDFSGSIKFPLCSTSTSQNWDKPYMKFSWQNTTLTWRNICSLCWNDDDICTFCRCRIIFVRNGFIKILFFLCGLYRWGIKNQIFGPILGPKMTWMASQRPPCNAVNTKKVVFLGVPSWL